MRRAAPRVGLCDAEANGAWPWRTGRTKAPKCGVTEAHAARCSGLTPDSDAIDARGARGVVGGSDGGQKQRDARREVDNGAHVADMMQR